MNNIVSPLEKIDFYKISHKDMYPKGTEVVYSNFTPRSARIYQQKADVVRIENYKRDKAISNTSKMVFVGLQALILKEFIGLWNDAFFDKPFEEAVQSYVDTLTSAFGSAPDVAHLKELWDIGYLPLEIRALPEGLLVDMGIPVLTVENTYNRFYWLTNYIETVLSAELWGPCTNATIAYQYRTIINHFAELTGADPSFGNWQGHDFSYRGMMTSEAAAMAGIGHMLSFTGTDTVPVFPYLRKFYEGDKTFIGGSVPASEHSVMCAGGQESERETFKRIITEAYPSGIVSIVSDTWDFFNVLDTIAPSLKDEILNRGADAFGNSKVVFRPDSGDPQRILCGYDVIASLDLGNSIEVGHILDACDFVTFSPDYSEQDEENAYEGLVEVVCDLTTGKYFIVEANYSQYYGETELDNYTVVREVSESEVMGAVRTLDKYFGSTVNAKGFKALNSKVGLIYGDSITLQRCYDILDNLLRLGYESTSVVFGIGSYTYQYNTRDTFGLAMKATWCQVNGEGYAIYKDPKTDSGTKKSARGRLAVIRNAEGSLELIQDVPLGVEVEGDLLRVVFRNGTLYNKQSLADIRSTLGVMR